MSSLLTGWSTLREPQSLAFPHGNRNETLESGSQAHGLKLRGRRGREPSPKDREGTPGDKGHHKVLYVP